jgi:transaldolase
MSRKTSYLEWLIGSTDTRCWIDSADPMVWDKSIGMGFTGVTTNPMLIYQALSGKKGLLEAEIERLLPKQAPKETLPAAVTGIVTQQAAGLWRKVYEASGGRAGYVCAQVNPALAANRDAMVSMAKEYHLRAPNIAVKLPVTAAGLDALEVCVAEGIPVTATVSFTVSQVIAIAESYRRGLANARKSGNTPGRCFAVIMIGRINDYLRNVAQDNGVSVSESEIGQAGVAIAKRSCHIYRDRGYEAVLLMAGFREISQVTELAGADVVATLSPQIVSALAERDLPQERRDDRDLDPQVTRTLGKLPEFARSYEEGAMGPKDFIAFGEVQRTLTQFHEAGWRALESLLTADSK